MILSRRRRFELFACMATPALTCVLLALIMLVPKHASGLDNFMPILTLAPVFFWGLRTGPEMPFWFVFLLGLLLDAGTGQPLGLSSLLYMIFLGIVYAQSKYITKEGFLIKWGYFAGLVFVNQLLSWAALSLFAGSMLAIGAALMQWLFTICLFPLLYKLFELVDALVYRRRWQIMHGQ